ncbi:MAG TPA: hypothetical protein VK427_06650 [Kofleriaceae bacterium]|nr:hypothetical protein [Kofleriaceae bacterium]
MRTSLIAILFLAACSKSSDTNKSGGSSDCATAVASSVDKTIALRRGPNAPAMTAAEAEVPAKLKVALAKACTDDKWSAEVITCFKTADDMSSCKNQLTPEQRGGYTRAAMSVMQGAGGTGGMPGHGMGAPGGHGAPAGGAPASGPGAHGGGAPGSAGDGPAGGSSAAGGAPDGAGSASPGSAGAGTPGSSGAAGSAK